MKTLRLVLKATLLVSIFFTVLTQSNTMSHNHKKEENIMNNTNDNLVNLGIDNSDRETVAKLLNVLLSDEYLLYTKTNAYHWNVYGPAFDQFHKFFELQYTELTEFFDDIAERTRALGFRALGSMSEFLEHTRLKEEAPGAAPKDLEMVRSLLNDHESIIRSVRSDLKTCAKQIDDGTENFLQDLIEKHEKMAWMLRSFIETTPPQDPQ